MSLSLYDVSVPLYIRSLNNLNGILSKGAAHGSESTLIAAQLVADMKGLTFQIQIISVLCRELATRLGKSAPLPDLVDDMTTFAALQERVSFTIKFLEALDPKSMDGEEEKEIVLKLPSGDLVFTGSSFVLDFMIPSFYFHYNMAYALLRKEGVPLGKADYLGPLN